MATTIVFPPTEIQAIDTALQAGRGAEASVLGQAFTVQRLTNTTSVGVSSTVPVYQNFPAVLRRFTSKVGLENEIFSLLAFNFICDNTYLKTGDLLTNTGYGSEPMGIFTIASKRPRRETIAMRTEWNIFISRPIPLGGAAADQPTSGAIVAAGYIGTAKAQEQILTLTDGLFEFTADPGAQTAAIPCGIQPLNRVKDAKLPKLPTALYREHFLAYVPVLPGEQLNELDRLNLPNSDRYEIALIFSTDTTGLAGNICIVERLAN